MKKLKKRRTQSDHNKMFLAAVIVFTTLVLLTIMTARISRIYRGSSPVIDYSITPIVHPTDGTGWKTFIHPDHLFTFRYPASWNVSLTKSDARDRNYKLLLTYEDRGKPYRIEFMRGGRGASQFDSVRRDTVSYGPHTGYKNTYIKDKVPVEQVITFRNMNLIKPYIAIEAQLPGTNSEKYIELIKTMASSIKRTE